MARAALILDTLLRAVAPEGERAEALARIAPLVPQLPSDLAAWVSLAQGDAASLDRAQGLADGLADRALAVAVGLARSRAARARGDAKAAVEHAEEALELARRRSDPVQIEAALQVLLKAHVDRGCFGVAQEVADQLRAVRREHGLDGLPTHNLGLLACRLADHEAWEAALLHDLEVHRRRGGLAEEAWTLHNLGALRASQNRYRTRPSPIWRPPTPWRISWGCGIWPRWCARRASAWRWRRWTSRPWTSCRPRPWILAGDDARARAVALLDRAVVALYQELPELGARAEVAVAAAVACQDRVLATCADQVQALALGLSGDLDEAEALLARTTAWIHREACPRDLPPMADLIGGMLAALRARADPLARSEADSGPRGAGRGPGPRPGVPVGAGPGPVPRGLDRRVWVGPDRGSTSFSRFGSTDPSAFTAVLALAFSPDGTRLASGHMGGDVNVWDVASGELRSTVRGCHESVSGVAWRSDDRLAVVGRDVDDGPMVYLFDVP